MASGFTRDEILNTNWQEKINNATNDADRKRFEQARNEKIASKEYQGWGGKQQQTNNYQGSTYTPPPVSRPSTPSRPSVNEWVPPAQRQPDTGFNPGYQTQPKPQKSMQDYLSQSGGDYSLAIVFAQRDGANAQTIRDLQAGRQEKINRPKEQGGYGGNDPYHGRHNIMGNPDYWGAGQNLPGVQPWERPNVYDPNHSKGPGWTPGVDYVGQAMQHAAQGDGMAMHDALMREGFKRYDTNDPGSLDLLAAYAKAEQKERESEKAEAQYRQEIADNQKLLEQLGVAGKNIGAVNGWKTLGVGSDHYVVYDGEGNPVRAFRRGSNVKWQAPHYTPDQIESLKQYYSGEGTYADNYYLKHNAEAEQKGFGRLLDRQGNFVADLGQSRPSGGSPASGVGGRPYENSGLGGKLPPENHGDGYGGGSSSGSSSYYPGYQPSSGDAYLRQLAEQRKAAEMERLKAAYEENLRKLQENAGLIGDSYDEQRNQAAANNDLQRMQMAELGIAQGLNTGATGQMALGQSMAYQGQMGQLGSQEAKAQNELNNAIAALKQQYLADLAASQAGIDADLNDALYREFVRQQQAAQAAQQQALENERWQMQWDAQQQQQQWENQFAQSQWDAKQQALMAQAAPTTTQTGGSGRGNGGGNVLDEYVSTGRGYDNGGLSPDKIKQIQTAIGVTPDGMWGSNSSSTAAGLAGNRATGDSLTAEEAWQLWGGGVEDFGNLTRTLQGLMATGQKDAADAFVKRYWNQLNLSQANEWDTMVNRFYGK